MSTFRLWKCGGSLYNTRDGRQAVVLESNIIIDSMKRIWQGRVDGEWTEWNEDGTHCGGERGMDLTEEVPA